VIPFAFLHVRRQGGGADDRAHVPRTIDTSDFPAVDAAGEGPAHAGLEEASADLSLRHGTWFAVAVVGIMLAEQTLMNGGVLIVAANSGGAALTLGLTGFVFNVMLIVRAPLQLFQAIQTSLLPHLTGLEATAGHDAFARAIRTTVLAILAFAAIVALALLLVGPFALRHVFFGQHYGYKGFGLALIGVGMGLHLCSGALNQAALARDRARAAACCWLLAAAIFVGWMLLPTISEQLLRAEVGYAGATALLALALTALYRQGPRRIEAATG
ncbi:MAG TPA: hypothetical protein VF706_04570, partial [Solirubrobacteraceae bacterium]